MSLYFKYSSLTLFLLPLLLGFRELLVNLDPLALLESADLSVKPAQWVLRVHP